MMINPDTRRIVCAAALGECGRIICSPRHFDELMHKQIESMVPPFDGDNAIQGFVDQWGTFFDREDSLGIAKRQNQIIRDIGYEPTELFSEMLY